MVPARVERTPIAPEMLVKSTSAVKAVKFVDLMLENATNTFTETPAMMKDKF